MNIKIIDDIKRAQATADASVKTVNGNAPDAAGNVDLGTIADLVSMEEIRKSWIGVPRYWRSTTLPANHCWANGDFISFADWPELKEVYDAGGFAGMLLAYNASSEQQAANLGKWRPDAANPTGLYTPNLGGQFFRNWGPESDKEAGGWGRDEIRNITGEHSPLGSYSVMSGAFQQKGARASNYAGTSSGSHTAEQFDASKVVPTGPQNVPQHVWQPVCLYLGKHS